MVLYVTFFVLIQRTDPACGGARRSQSNQRKIKAADNFGAAVYELAHAIQLPFALLRVKQYCLLLAIAASS